MFFFCLSFCGAEERMGEIILNFICTQFMKYIFTDVEQIGVNQCLIFYATELSEILKVFLYKYSKIL